MIKTGLLVGPDLDGLADFREEVDSGDVKLLISDETVDDVHRIFEEETIDIILFGPYDEPEAEILRHISKISPDTLAICLSPVHVRPETVSGILKGLSG